MTSIFYFVIKWINKSIIKNDLEIAHPHSWCNWTLEMLVFDPERGKPEYMYQGKTSRSKGENLIWLRCRDLNSGHIGERWVLSPLRHPSILSLSIYVYICIWSYRYRSHRSHRPPRPLYILENLFQQPLPRRVPVGLFPCYTQRDSTWTGLVLECSASLLYLVEFQSSCMFLSPLGDLLLRLLRSSKPMFKWVDRVVLCPPNSSINVNWGFLFGWILKTSLTRQESIAVHLSGS